MTGEENGKGVIGDGKGREKGVSEERWMMVRGRRSSRSR